MDQSDHGRNPNGQSKGKMQTLTGSGIRLVLESKRNLELIYADASWQRKNPSSTGSIPRHCSNFFFFTSHQRSNLFFRCWPEGIPSERYLFSRLPVSLQLQCQRRRKPVRDENRAKFVTLLFVDDVEMKPCEMNLVSWNEISYFEIILRVEMTSARQ